MRTPSPKVIFPIAALSLLSCTTIMAQFNYDESKVPAYELPELLKLNDGTPVKAAATWKKKRRAEVLELFRSEVYGRRPGRPEGLRFEVTVSYTHLTLPTNREV